MNAKTIGLGLVSAALLCAPAMAAPTLQIKNAAVRVVVVPEDRSDIAVDVFGANPSLPLTVTRIGGDVIVDGHLPSFLTSCHGSGDGLHAFVFGKGDFPVAEFPEILVHTPMSVNVNADGIVQGSVARSQDLSVRDGGCGDWTVANVAGALDAQVSGIGAIRAGSAHSADLTLSGSGRLSAVSVAAQLNARLSGSGAIGVQSAGSADVTITGTGAVKTGPLTGGLSADISGAGGLDVASLEGPLTADVSGVGNVNIPGGHATTLMAHVSGSGNVRFGGVADSLDASVSGVGSVDVAKVTGSVNQHVSGVGYIHIGGR